MAARSSDPPSDPPVGDRWCLFCLTLSPGWRASPIYRCSTSTATPHAARQLHKRGCDAEHRAGP